jgi:hypothetical protein
MKRASFMSKLFSEPADGASQNNSKPPEIDVIERAEVFEYERYIDETWSSSNLVCFGKNRDPQNYQWISGESNSFPFDLAPKRGWVFKGEWELDVYDDCDPQGWHYGDTISQLEIGKGVKIKDEGMTYYVRRRR